MTLARLSYTDKDGFRRSVELDVPEDVDTDTLAALVADVDPDATFEYAVKA
jgi:hypothetical protein